MAPEGSGRTSSTVTLRCKSSATDNASKPGPRLLVEAGTEITLQGSAIVSQGNDSRGSQAPTRGQEARRNPLPKREVLISWSPVSSVAAAVLRNSSTKQKTRR